MVARMVLPLACVLAAVVRTHGEGPPARAVDRYGDPLPPGAVARLGTHRLRHGNSVTAVAFSPDGKTVASAGDGPAARLWDLATGKEVRWFTARVFAPQCLHFSPDGKTLIGGGGLRSKVLCVWEVSTGRLLRQFGEVPLMGEEGLADPVYEVSWGALSPDGKLFASANDAIHLRRLDTGKERRPLPGDSKRGRYVCVAFSPDGKILASGGQDDVVRLWDPATGKQLRQMRGHGDSILCLAFSADGKVLVSGSRDRQVRLWDPATGKEIRRLEGHEKPIRSLLFTPDGKGLISGSGDRVLLWDAATGKEVRRFRGHDRSAQALALSPDGRTLAAGGHDGTVRLWEVNTGKPVLPFDGHRDRVESIAFAPDGKTLASAAPDAVYLWNVGDRRTIRRFGEEAVEAQSVAFAPDGATLASGHFHGRVRLWETSTGKERRSFRGPEGVFPRVAFAPDGRSLSAWDWSGLLYRWQPGAGKRLSKLGGFRDEEDIGDCVLSPDGTALAVGDTERSVQLRSTADGKLLPGLGKPAPRGIPVAFSPDGTALAVSGREGLLLLEIATGRVLTRIKGHRASARTSAFSPDGKTFVVAGQIFRLWEVSTGRERRRFRGHRRSVHSLAFSPDGRLLASASEDTTILLWAVTAAPPRAAEPLALWEDLAGPDAARAYDALCALMQKPGPAVTLLREHLSAAVPVSPQRIARLLDGLDSDRFAVRESASRELEALGEVTRPALVKLLEGKPSLDVRRRAELLLTKLDRPPAGRRLRELRAVELLEHLGTPGAREILRKLADGSPPARLTGEAKAALGRLESRGRKAP